MLEDLYDAAARASLLKTASLNGQPVSVDFRAPDEMLLSGIASSHDYTLRLPVSRLGSLARGDTISIDQQSYRVRDITAIGDGSECQVSLTRL